MSKNVCYIYSILGKTVNPMGISSYIKKLKPQFHEEEGTQSNLCVFAIDHCTILVGIYHLAKDKEIYNKPTQLWLLVAMRTEPLKHIGREKLTCGIVILSVQFIYIAMINWSTTTFHVQ